jgi:NADP-dependent 3-hydroxy acid dehydrogenase YdfG
MTTYQNRSSRTAVVTGAASGMGAATAQLLGDSGARVALLARRTDVLTELAGKIGDRALPVTVDITDQASVDRATTAILGRVDLVVNAAGVMLPNPVSAERSDEWQRMIDTNLTGTLRMIRAFTSDLVAAAADSSAADLVVVSSVAAHIALPEYAVYNATKAALTHLAASLRTELSPQDVRVTNIEPGLTRTELGNHIDNTQHSEQLAAAFDGLGGLTPDEIADVIGYVTNLPRQVSLS